ncbi:hypothetical protein ACO2Q3_20995 [Caulobacter sp. KR2-114]|uniref:hypothetical protein n=1 Tax=Caulobacter sp. KR2-114 TaxID=3400912 RepID=UPI003C077E3F
MRPLAALALLPALAGCAVVSVRAEGGRPSVGVYPFGVHISRGDAQAVSVSARAAGLSYGCGFGTAGLARLDCDLIDVRACSAALVHAPVSDPSLLDRLAGATRAQCPKIEVTP